MATRIVRIDDLSGETLYGGSPIRFGLEDVEYEIDLSPTHHAQLRDAFAPYIEAALRVRRAHYRKTSLPRSEPKQHRPRKRT